MTATCASAKLTGLKSIDVGGPAPLEPTSEFGGQIAVDLEADADFYKNRSRPGHETFLHFSIGRVPK